MSKLSLSPSVRTATDAATSRFSEVAREAGGKDGRVSRKEAERIADRSDDGRHYARAALRFLDRKGQKSAAVHVMVAGAQGDFEQAMRVAAGADQRLSGADQQNLPHDLQEVVRALQGKSGAKPPQPSNDLGTTLATLTAGMQNWSESESPVLSFVLAADAPITAKLVSTSVEALYEQNKDALAGGARNVDVEALGNQPVLTRDAAEFLTQKATVHDSGDELAVAYAARWQALADALGRLAEMQLFRFGTVEATYVLAGRTADGRIAGIMTGAVET